MATSNGNHVVLSAEAKFAQGLAGNEKVVRDRATRKLQKWMVAKSATKIGFSSEDFVKIWKGLHFCMWMSDKPLIQEELADTIASLVHCFNKAPGLGVLFYSIHVRTLAREWGLLDKWRLNKFLMLTRRCLTQVMAFLKNHEWNADLVQQFAEGFYDEVLSPSVSDPFAEALKLHYTDVYIDELNAVGGGEVPSDVLTLMLEPFTRTLMNPQSDTLLRHIKDNIFKCILDESVSFVDEDGGDDDEDDVNKFRLKFDFGPFAEHLFSKLANYESGAKSRRTIYSILTQFRQFAAGKYKTSDSLPSMNACRDLTEEDFDKAVQRLQKRERRWEREGMQQKRHPSKDLRETYVEVTDGEDRSNEPMILQRIVTSAAVARKKRKADGQDGKSAKIRGNKFKMGLGKEKKKAKSGVSVDEDESWGIDVGEVEMVDSSGAGEKVKDEGGVDKKVNAEGGVDKKVKAEGGVDKKVKAEGGVDKKVKAEGGVDKKVKTEGGVDKKVRGDSAKKQSRKRNAVIGKDDSENDSGVGREISDSSACDSKKLKVSGCVDGDGCRGEPKHGGGVEMRKGGERKKKVLKDRNLDESGRRKILRNGKRNGKYSVRNGELDKSLTVLTSAGMFMVVDASGVNADKGKAWTVDAVSAETESDAMAHGVRDEGNDPEDRFDCSLENNAAFGALKKKKSNVGGLGSPMKSGVIKTKKKGRNDDMKKVEVIAVEEEKLTVVTSGGDTVSCLTNESSVGTNKVQENAPCGFNEKTSSVDVDWIPCSETAEVTHKNPAPPVQKVNEQEKPDSVRSSLVCPKTTVNVTQNNSNSPDKTVLAANPKLAQQSSSSPKQSGKSAGDISDDVKSPACFARFTSSQSPPALIKRALRRMSTSKPPTPKFKLSTPVLKLSTPNLKQSTPNLKQSTPNIKSMGKTFAFTPMSAKKRVSFGMHRNTSLNFEDSINFSPGLPFNPRNIPDQGILKATPIKKTPKTTPTKKTLKATPNKKNPTRSRSIGLFKATDFS